jgi:hypothetical protein
MQDQKEHLLNGLINKEIQDTQKSERLSDELKVKLDNSLGEIYKILGKIFAINKRYLINGNIKDTFDELNGIIPYAALEFDENKVKNNRNFASFVANRSFLRLLDSSRRNNRPYVNLTLNNRKISDILKSVGLEDIDFENESSISKLKENNIDIDRLERLVKKRDTYIKKTTEINQPIKTNDINLHKIDWKDYKDVIKEKTNKHFPDNDNIYNVIINEYVLPKCDGSPYRTIEDIAKKMNVSKTMVYNVIRSDKMKEFFRDLQEK